jgi:hypothetical protein
MRMPICDRCLAIPAASVRQRLPLASRPSNPSEMDGTTFRQPLPEALAANLATGYSHLLEIDAPFNREL